MGRNNTSALQRFHQGAIASVHSCWESTLCIAQIAMLHCVFIHSQARPLPVERGCWLSPPPRRKANNRMQHSPPPVLHFRLSPPILLPGGLFHARKKVAGVGTLRDLRF